MRTAHRKELSKNNLNTLLSIIVQLCNCIQNHSQPTETAVARIPAAENSRFFIDTTSIELALLIEEYTCKSCAEVQLYCSSYFLTVPTGEGWSRCSIKWNRGTF